jgi:hypothetical protein
MLIMQVLIMQVLITQVLISALTPEGVPVRAG